MKKSFIGAVVVGIVVAFIAILGILMLKDVSGNTPLPLDIDIAYKEIQIRGMPGVARFVVIDTAGYNYFVTEERFATILFPQKIGENLYRMPDGSLFTLLDKAGTR